MPPRVARLRSEDAGRLVAAELTGPGAFCGLVVVPGVGVGVSGPTTCIAVPSEDLAAVVALIDAAAAPRWVWWSAQSAARALVEVGYRARAAWDLAAVHRLLHGGWSADPDVVWAAAHGLDPDSIPTVGQLDLLGAAADASAPDADGAVEEAVRPDGYLRPDWASQAWLRAPTSGVPDHTGCGRPPRSLRRRLLRDAVSSTRSASGPNERLDRAAQWAWLACEAARRQEQALRRLPEPRAAAPEPSLALLTARSESLAELLAVELSVDGLPLDRAAAEAILLPLIGERPLDADHESHLRARRDAEVLRHLPGTDVRNPARVKAALAVIGIDVPDTRSWRLRQFAGAHPAVDALLAWRKLDRIATTYGYAWLDRHVGADGRLRGAWSGSDGAAGRMTAQSGLHNMPAELRGAVRADPGMVFVRSDLGQVEPRVLAAVSGDAGLALATAADDLYLPVAGQLGCDRAIAKVAVLAAMYGQTSGAAGEALRRMEAAYPIALRYLREADRRGRDGRDVRTYGGRLVRMWGDPVPAPGSSSDRAARAAVAARGRFARNAVIQGAAAELFKMWAATVRARVGDIGGRLVLCLHDELLVHVPAAVAERTTEIVESALEEVTVRWAGSSRVRFVADVRVLERWSDAKATSVPSDPEGATS